MSIFDKFTKKGEDEAVSTPEKAKVSIARKDEVVAEAKKETVEAKKTKATTDNGSKVYGILVRPLITEKATNLSKSNQYVFEVSVKANKIQIAHAIEARYGVKPAKVNVLNNFGKVVRRGKSTGRTKDWRKAIVTLPVGKSIQIHEGV